MTLPRLLVLVAAGAGLCLSVLFVLRREDSVVAPVGAAVAPQVESRRFEDWVPLLREGTEVTFSTRTASTDANAPPGPATAVGQQTTLGPLDPAQLQQSVRMLEGLAQGRFEKLHALPPVTTPGACHELVVQAELLADAEEAAAAADALAHGSYFTTRPGALPPGPPEAGLVQFAAKKGEAFVNVSVIIPWTRYPRFAEAWHYKLEVAANFPEYVVGEFNKKELAWRQAAIERYETTELVRQKTTEYMAFRARWFPRGVRIDVGNALLLPERSLSLAR